jgi:hypothetical protein
MKDRKLPISWKTLAHGMTIVESVTFVPELEFAFTGLAPVLWALMSHCGL